MVRAYLCVNAYSSGRLFNNPVSRLAPYSRVGAYSRQALSGNIELHNLHCVLVVINIRVAAY